MGTSRAPRQAATAKAAGAPETGARGAPLPQGGDAPGPERVVMRPPPEGDDSDRQKALDRVKSDLHEKGDLSVTLRSHLGRMRPNSPLGMWEELSFELHSIGRPKLARRIAEVCKEIRISEWKGIVNDDGILSHLRPMLSQFTYAGDDAAESLRFKIASMSGIVRSTLVPGRKVRALVVNMARFGSLADMRMARVTVEELFVRRGHHWAACGICEDILRFSGRDRGRMMASTLVEDIAGDILAELQRLKSGDYAFSVDRELLPLLASPADASRDRLLERLVLLLVRRAGPLGLVTTRGPRGPARLFWASALAHRVSAHTRRFGPGEIARHAELRHRRSFAFLGLGRATAASRLETRAHALAENASLAIALRGLAGVRAPLPPGQDALGLLDRLLGHMERRGIDAGPEATKKWRAGMLGPRLWGSLLEMEAHLRLRMDGAAVRAAPGGRGVALELDGLRVEAYSPLDGRPPEHDRAARAGDSGHMAEGDMFGQAGHGNGARRTMVIVDCTVGAPAGLETLAGALSAGFSQGGQPGALCLVRRERGRHERLLVKSPYREQQVPDPVADPVMRALDLDIDEPGGAEP